MNIDYCIKSVIAHKKYDPTIAIYFMGLTITSERTKLQLFKSYIVENIFYDKELTEKLIDIFCEVQKIYFAFNRFIYLYKFKKAKRENICLDLYLRPLNRLDDDDKIQILHMDSVYTFSIYDLIHMWKESLTHSDCFFPRPKPLKNPFTNLPFKMYNLYNIYFKLQCRKKLIPFYINEFFRLGFNYNLFTIKFHSALKDYAIENHIQKSDNDELFEDIQSMCEKLNEMYGDTFRVNTINNIREKNVIVDTLKPYLLLFYRYTYSRNSLLKKKCIKLLKREIKLFFEANQVFGRRLVFTTSINKNNDVETPTITLTSSTKRFLHQIKYFH